MTGVKKVIVLTRGKWERRGLKEACLSADRSKLMTKECHADLFRTNFLHDDQPFFEVIYIITSKSTWSIFLSHGFVANAFCLTTKGWLEFHANIPMSAFEMLAN